MPDMHLGTEGSSEERPVLTEFTFLVGGDKW